MNRHTFTRSFAWPLWAALLCGTAVQCDKQSSSSADLATSVDLAATADLASAADLASPADLATMADLTPQVDMAGTSGDRCVIALALPTDNVARNGTTVGFSDDYQFINTAATCSALTGFTYKGKDVTYAVEIPAGKTLTVTLTPNFTGGTWYPMLALVSDCATPGPSCLAAQDTVVPNSKDRVVTYQNAGMAARNLFVLVDSYDGTLSGQYSIKAALN